MENIEIMRVPGNDDNLHVLPALLATLYTPFVNGKSKKFSAYVIVHYILYRNRPLRQLLRLMVLHFVMDR
jgi:Icc-related predicted phosphoesterase